MVNPELLQPVDEASRRQAKALLRAARYGALACLDPAIGAPLASQVNLATDIDGRPVFLISELSLHFAALAEDGRCALLVGTPGKGDPAAHARVSVMGRAEKLVEADDVARVRRRFLGKHPKAALYVDFGDFAFWRVTPRAASLNAGFGKAYEMQGGDVICDVEGCPGLAELEDEAVAHMNEAHGDAVSLYAAQLAGQAAGDWQIASLDQEGIDLVVGDRTARLWFEPALTSADELRPRLVALANEARDKAG